MRHLSLCALALLFALGCDDRREPPPDGGRFDAGGSPSTDGGAGGDAGAPGDGGGGGGSDAGMSLADIGLTFSGCAPDFSGHVVVVNSADSIAVSSTSGSALTGSIQLALADPPGTVSLSTQHRVDTGSVINVVVDTSWTNIAMDSAGVLSGSVTDPIGGTLTIRTYDEAAGMVDVDFTAVTLQNPSDGSICRVDGTLRTFGLSF